ncbi:MAG: acetyltransferase [Campylobacterota bacterium]|nr:acetyltransferase [Campylobacterota bacterium]
MGGGGHCKSCIDVIEQENRYKIVGIVDKKELIGQKVLGYKIIACDDDLPNLFKIYKNALITIGQIKSNNLRVKIFNNLKSIGYNLPTIISPFAYVSKHSFIDEGTIIMHNSMINADVRIGKNCIINTKALLEHDVKVEDNCHISTASVINGGTIIKANNFIGSNSVTKENIEVNRFVKAGSLIV